MTSIITVPLNKLIADPKNVRKSYNQNGIQELAASIRADGLLQDPIVRKAEKKGFYYVTAGGRRVAALTYLAEHNERKADTPVQCKLIDGDNAETVSLTENIMREAMNPAEELVAFTTLIESGETITSIAQRFGVTETIVRKRLALGRVSPVLMRLFANNEIDLRQLEAFTLTDDHAEQERVWNSLNPYNRHSVTIRNALTGEGIAATDKRVIFIGGLDAYEKAGGAVKRDLFDDAGGFVCDIALLDKMTMEALETAADAVRSEGWQWVDARSDYSYSDYEQYSRRYPEPVELPTEEQEEWEQLTIEHDDLSQILDERDGSDEEKQRYAELENRIDVLREKSFGFKANVLDIGGAVVCLTYQGEIRIERGFVPRKQINPERDDTQHPSARPDKPGYTQSLLEDLSAQKTAALRAELASNSAIALVSVVHALLLPAIYRGTTIQSALQITLQHEALGGYMSDAETSKGLNALDALRAKFSAQLPKDAADLFVWLSDKTTEQLLELLAFAAAHSVNVVEKKYNDRRHALVQGNELGRALKANMSDWFTTTGSNFLNRVNRQAIEQAVTEAKGDQAALAVKAASKKNEAVVIAERLLEGSNWIPAPLRLAPATVATADDDAEDQD